MRLSESRLAKNHLFSCSIAPNAEWIASVSVTQRTVFVGRMQDIAPNGLLGAISCHRKSDREYTFHEKFFSSMVWEMLTLLSGNAS